MHTVGSERDELLVDTIALLLREHFGRRLSTKRKRESEPTAHVAELISSVEQGGREFRRRVGEWSGRESQMALLAAVDDFGEGSRGLRELRQERRRASTPATVRKSITPHLFFTRGFAEPHIVRCCYTVYFHMQKVPRQLLARAMPVSGGTIPALPYNVAARRQQEKRTAASTMRDHLTAWLKTEAGVEWATYRASLFDVDNDGDGDDRDDGDDDASEGPEGAHGGVASGSELREQVWLDADTIELEVVSVDHSSLCRHLHHSNSWCRCGTCGHRRACGECCCRRQRHCRLG